MITKSFPNFCGKGIHNLCAVVRKQGEQLSVNNKNLPNPGVTVLPLCEMRLKLGAYTTKYYALFERPMNNQSMPWTDVAHFTKLRTLTDNHKDPDNTPESSKRVIISVLANTIALSTLLQQ